MQTYSLSMEPSIYEGLGVDNCRICGVMIGKRDRQATIKYKYPQSRYEWCRYYRVGTCTAALCPGDCSVQLFCGKLPDLTLFKVVERREKAGVKVPILISPVWTAGDDDNGLIVCIESLVSEEEADDLYDCTCNLHVRCDDSSLSHWGALHSLCWDWSKRVVGDLYEKRPVLWFESLRLAWEMSVSQFSAMQVDVPYGAEYRKLDFLNDLETDGGEVLNEKMSVMTDPTNISAIQQLLKRSRRMLRQRGAGSTYNIPRLATRSKDAIFKAQGRHPINLPLDIQQAVVDFVSDPTDVSNAVLAFCWRLPDSYWRSRFPRDMIFEVDDYPWEELDWQYLYIEFDRLSKQNIRGLQNRQRIFNILHVVRDLFVEALGDKQGYRLADR